MAEKYFYSKKNITTDEGSTFELKYYILKSNKESEVMVYGAEISKQQVVNGLVYTEVKSVENLCADECAAMLLLRIISDATVTPMALETTLMEMQQDDRFAEIFINKVHNAV